MKRLFLAYIFFIITTIIATTTVVSTIVVPHNIDYVRSSLAASMYASLFSKISGEAKKSIMGGIFAELFVEGLGRASFLPEKLKKGKMFFYKFLIPPIALYWWMKEGYSFTKELFTPQDKLEFNSNHQIKKPIQYLFYLNKMISKLDVEKRENDLSLLDKLTLCSNENQNDFKQGDVSIQNFLSQVCDLNIMLHDIVSDVCRESSKKNYVLRTFLDYFEQSIHDSYNKFILVEGKNNREKNYIEMDGTIKKIGDLVKFISLKINSQIIEKENELEYEQKDKDTIEKLFRSYIDYLIAIWRRTLFLTSYCQEKYSKDNAMPFEEKMDKAQKQLESSWLYQNIWKRFHNDKH